MKEFGKVMPKALAMLVAMSILLGVVYPAVITGISQIAFPFQANGSILTDESGNTEGSALLAQPFSDDAHLWGRPTSTNYGAFTDSDGNPVSWAGPTNLSPAGADEEDAVAERVDAMRAANPDRGDEPVPVDLVTVSGSGMDPDISPAAAEYQVPRIAKASGLSEDKVREIISQNTTGRFLGVFGEPTVNVLKVNLALDAAK